MQSIKYINYRKFDNLFIIEIDNNVNFLNTDYNLYELCKLIEYGNINIKGSHIYSDCFDFIRNHMQTLINIYKFQRGDI